MTPPAPLLDAAALRVRADGLMVVADAADRAAARFAARSLMGTPDPEAEAIRRALAQLARSHRAAGGSLTQYAGELEGAAQRRGALDELVEAARLAPATDRDVLAHVRELRNQLVERRELELARAAERCASTISAATPAASTATEISGAVVLALGHARARLLELAGPDPSPDDAARGSVA